MIFKNINKLRLFSVYNWLEKSILGAIIIFNFINNNILYDMFANCVKLPYEEGQVDSGFDLLIKGMYQVAVMLNESLEVKLSGFSQFYEFFLKSFLLLIFLTNSLLASFFFEPFLIFSSFQDVFLLIFHFHQLSRLFCTPSQFLDFFFHFFIQKILPLTIFLFFLIF